MVLIIMFNIQTLNKISDAGISKFGENYCVCDEASSPEAIMVRSASLHDHDFPESLLAIARAGAGVNNIPVEKCTEKGIVVFNTPGANAGAVKELVILSLLMSSRKVCDATLWVKEQNGPDIAKVCEKGKSQFAGPELKGKKLGIVGLGAIGGMVANTALHFGMDVYGYDPFVSVGSAWNLSRHVHHVKDLDSIFKTCDYISLHVPATGDTKEMICKENIAKMKDGVRIINLARGELVNNQDIVEATNSGKVARYVTDFASPEIVDKKDIVVFPHLGASTPESEDNCAKMAADQLIDYLENGNIVNSVNMPRTVMDRNGVSRACVIHKNIATMLTKIAAVVSEDSGNISNMLNKSRGDIAYTILDIDAKANGTLKAKLEAIEGVVSARVV